MANKIRIGDTNGHKGVLIQWDGHTPEDLVDAINQLGRLPMQALSGPVRRSASAIQRLARQYAPRRTGALQTGIIVSRKERTSRPGKVGYQVTLAAEMNDVFVHYSKAGKRGYYPSAQEYGFRLRNGKRYAGRHYLRDAGDAMGAEHEKIVIDGAWAKIQAIWKKEHPGAAGDSSGPSE